ncbi:MAG: DUF927 domain-containing protein, partial [Oscillospiraceae bacterium]
MEVRQIGKEDVVVIPQWQKEDYSGTEPYDWLYKYKSDRFSMLQFRDIIKEQAKKEGVTNFVARFNAFLESKKQEKAIAADNVTCFDGQPLELLCPGYTCEDAGIITTDHFGFDVVVCPHPIEPIKRLVNIDTGEVKLELAFKRGKRWQQMTFEKALLASSQQIVQLSKFGIGVNSENSRELVKFVSAMENTNYDKIGEVNSVGRLGWISDGSFSPYNGELRFDGDSCYQHMFNAVQERGSFEKWLEEIKAVRRYGLTAKVILAASFASVLVEPCNMMPFFVHLWGGAGAGKTVGLMLAASVWANPILGEYIHTLNSTAVGQEMMAGFVNSMPLILDELQTVSGKGGFDELIYKLAEGSGKLRGAKSGGVQRTQSWRNCILTTGEQPITSSNSGAGAVLRVIEIDCKSEKLFEDPRNVVDVLRHNYGFAGKRFVELLSTDGVMEKAKASQKSYFEKLLEKGAEEKQAIAASIILTADSLTAENFFKDKPLTVDEVYPLLATNSQVDKNRRAYEWVADFVAMNPNKFSA